MNIDLDALWRIIELQPAHPDTVRTHGTGRHTAAGEILVAVDQVGARSLLFPVEGEEAFAPDLSTKVWLGRRLLRWAGGEGQFVTVTCQVERLKPVFSTLAEDMLEAASDALRPGLVLRKVLDEWRDLLSAEKRTILPRNRLIGLLAELLTLTEVVASDPERNIGIWTGPEEALYDLRKGPRAIEVKGSLARESLTVEIHGVRQLEEPPNGQLHLVLVRMEEADGEGTVSLPDTIRGIADMGVDRHAFVERLALAGYDFADEDEYAKRRFRLVERRVYRIDENFPRIVPDTFLSGDPPSGILLIRYTVDLTGPTPTPLSSFEAEAVLSAFSAGK